MSSMEHAVLALRAAQVPKPKTGDKPFADADSQAWPPHSTLIVCLAAEPTGLQELVALRWRCYLRLGVEGVCVAEGIAISDAASEQVRQAVDDYAGSTPSPVRFQIGSLVQVHGVSAFADGPLDKYILG